MHRMNMGKEEFLTFFLQNLYSITKIQDMKIFLNSKSAYSFLKEEKYKEECDCETTFLIQRHLGAMDNIYRCINFQKNLIKRRELLELCHYPVLNITQEQENLLELTYSFLKNHGDIESVKEQYHLSQSTIEYMLQDSWLINVLNQETYRLLTETMMTELLVKDGPISKRKNIFTKVFHALKENQYDIEKTANDLNLKDYNIIKIVTCPHVQRYLSLEEQARVKECVEMYSSKKESYMQKTILDSGYQAIQQRDDLALVIIILSYIFNMDVSLLEKKFQKNKDEIEEILSKSGIEKFFNEEAIVIELRKGIQKIEQTPIHDISEELIQSVLKVVKQLEQCAFIAYGKKKDEIMENLTAIKVLMTSIHRRGVYDSKENTYNVYEVTYDNINFIQMPSSLKKYLSEEQIHQYYSYLKAGKLDFKNNKYFDFKNLSICQKYQVVIQTYYEVKCDIKLAAMQLKISAYTVSEYLKDVVQIESILGEEIYQDLLEQKRIHDAKTRKEYNNPNSSVDKSTFVRRYPLTEPLSKYVKRKGKKGGYKESND